MSYPSVLLNRSLLLFVSKLSFMLCSGDISVTHYNMQIGCIGQNTTDFILATLLDIAPFECARRCKETSKCRMFFYSHNSRTCSLHNAFWEDVTLKTAEGFVCFTDVRTFKYVGCFKDDANRIFNDAMWENGGQTTHNCFKYCHSKGYKYCGTQFSSFCYCGDVMKTGTAYAKVVDSECNTTCAGDSSSICGGPWRMSVYKII